MNDMFPGGSFIWVPLQQLLESMQVNIQQAAREEAALRRRIDALPPGDIGLQGEITKYGQAPSLHEQVNRERSNQVHWRKYAAYYRKEIAVKGAAFKVKIPVPHAHATPDVRPAPPVEADPRLPKDWNDEVPF